MTRHTVFKVKKSLEKLEEKWSCMSAAESAITALEKLKVQYISLR